MLLVVLALGGTGIGVALAQDAGAKAPPRPAPPPKAVRAQATVQGCLVSGVSGFAMLHERPSTEGVKQVDVTLLVKGLPDGKHAVHIHENGSCGSTDPVLAAQGLSNCMAAGGHFDPGPNSNSNPDGNHPHHMGDLINIEVKNGVGVLTATSSRITLSPGPNSVLDANGSAFIIHTQLDTYCPQAGTPDDPKPARCAGGTRDACAIILPATN
jgi:Cu-Zn family superoxide dismutase